MATGTVEERPLIVIVGPTASGKTSLAIEIAERYGGEIICADSRTIYKDMDIGTAKPTTEEQARVPHWGLDLVAPGERFTAADFKHYAVDKISEIRARDRLPILVGGTGLYIDAVVFDFQFGGQPNAKQRAELEALDVGALLEYCAKNNVMVPENSQNKRYVIRAIERQSISVIRQSHPIANCSIVGITTHRTQLRHRIGLRAEQLFQHGVVEEATLLGKKYGWENEAMTGNIYPICRSYLAAELSLEEAKEKFTTLDWRLAKRQMTWLQRNPYIEWLTLPGAGRYIARSLVAE